MKLHALVSDLETAKIAVEGGATVLQLRLKGRPTQEVVDEGRPFRHLCALHGITFVVNDDCEAAVELGADGVHLGRDDEGAEAAVEAGLMLGISAATIEDAVSGERARRGLHRRRPRVGDADEARRRPSDRARRTGRDL